MKKLFLAVLCVVVGTCFAADREPLLVVEKYDGTTCSTYTDGYKEIQSNYGDFNSNGQYFDIYWGVMCAKPDPRDIVHLRKSIGDLTQGDYTTLNNRLSQILNESAAKPH